MAYQLEISYNRRIMLQVIAYFLFFVTLLSPSESLASGFQSRAFSLFLNAINSHINGSLDAESFEFVPPSGFVFQNVSITDSYGKRVLSAKSVKGSFSLSELFSGKLLIDDLKIDSPTANLIIVDGHLNILDLFKKTTEGSSELPIKNVAISNADIALRLDKDPYRFSNLSFSISNLNSHHGILKFKNLQTKLVAEKLKVSAELAGALTIDLNLPNKAVKISYLGTTKALSALDITIPDISEFTFDGIYLDSHLDIVKTHLINPMIELDASGQLDFKSDLANLKGRVKLKHSAYLFTSKDLLLQFEDTILDVDISKDIASPTITASGTTEFQGALLSGTLEIDLASKAISGDITATSKENAFSLKRLVDQDILVSEPRLRARISGTLNSPVAVGSLQWNRISADWFNFGKFSALFNFRNNNIQFSKGTLVANDGSLNIYSLNLNIKSQELSGKGFVDNFDLLQMYKDAPKDSMAILSGSFQLSGSLRKPRILLSSRIQDFTLAGHNLGILEAIASYGESKTNVFDLSAELKGDLGSLQLRSAIDSSTKQMNTLLEIDKLSAEPILRFLNPWLTFAKSAASGTIEMKGPLSNPTTNFSLEVSADRPDPDLNLLHLRFDGTLINHMLNFRAKANIYCQESDIGPCLPSVPIELRGTGKFFDFNNFSIDYNGRIASKNFEKISDFLHKESIELSMDMEVAGKLAKAPRGVVLHKGTATVHSLIADLPDVLPLRLTEPFKIEWSQNDFQINPDAHFSLSEDVLSIGAKLKNGQVEAHLSGQIPLLLIRMLNRSFVEASGLAAGKVDISGSLSQPRINASVKPEMGSYLTLRSPQISIGFESGEILARVDPSDNALVHVNVNALALSIGNGSAVLNGAMSLDLRAPKEEDMLRNVNLDFKGTDVSYITRDFSLEGDVDLHLETFSNLHEVSGSILVNSGKLTQDFSLDNFEFRPIGNTRSSSSMPDFLNRVRANIGLKISSLDLSSNLVAFEFSGSAGGDDLFITGSPSNPRIHGKLELFDGRLDFPALNFDIPSTPIIFRNTLGRIIDPEIHLKATGDIPAGEFGSDKNKGDTSVELNIDGGIDQMQLDLKTISGDSNLDRTRLLYLLLNPGFGSNPEADLILLKPVTLELEKLVSQYTKTRFRIGALLQDSYLKTKFQWRLNSRFEIEGVTSTDQLFFQEARFKLFLFDHLPIGKEIFIEGRFGFNRSKTDTTQGSQTLKLNYRLFEL